MATVIKSLWAPQIKPDILSPRQILSVQASALTEMTKGVLVGELSESKRDDKEVVLTLDMYAPAIKYRHRVLTASHSTQLLYPVRLDADVFRYLDFTTTPRTLAEVYARGAKPESQADTDDELIKLVEKVLNSSEVVSMAQSLIAVSNEARATTNYIQYLKSLSESEIRLVIDDKISESCHEILDSEIFTSASATTNATGWGIDEYEIEDIDLSDEECIVTISFSASGEQDLDKVYAGDRVAGTAQAIIDSQGTVEYREIAAEVVYDSDESDSESQPGRAVEQVGSITTRLAALERIGFYDTRSQAGLEPLSDSDLSRERIYERDNQ